MLFRSGDNLLQGAVQFCEESNEIWIYCPFIRIEKLIELLKPASKCKAIIVRWQTMDILVGVTDFKKLYTYCKTNGIKLYRNTNIHLKVIRNETNSIFYGSANLTNMGMGQTNYNLELSGQYDKLQTEDVDYLNRILLESHLVTDDYFKLLEADIEKKKEKFTEIERLEDKNIEVIIQAKFLLSTLPQTNDPELLWEIYLSNFDESKYSLLQIDCAKHDMETYQVSQELGTLNKERFMNELGEGFNSTPFIVELKKEVSEQPNKIMGYTEIAIWIAKTTLTDPTPSRQDIRDDKWINRLHHWIRTLDEENFRSEKRHRSSGGPGGSDLLHFIGDRSPVTNVTLESVLNSLRIDSARGRKTPHQFVLLATINDLVVSGNDQTFSLQRVVEHFDTIWVKYEHLYPDVRRNSAMPLNAINRKQLIIFNFASEFIAIKDSRSEKEMKTKIQSIQISKTLLRLFGNGSITNEIILSYFESPIQ